jgi:beta-glucosidase-like glycosyl hydrolase
MKTKPFFLSLVFFIYAHMFYAISPEKKMVSVFNEQTRARAITVLNTLSLEQKIGQLFIVATLIDPASNDILMKNLPYKIDKEYIEQLITDYLVGGIIYLGTATPEQHIELTNHYQTLSKKAGIPPLLIAQDLEWGLSMRFKNIVSYPHNMALGAIQDNNLMYELGKEIGRQAHLVGVHMNLAPVVDVNNNPKNPIINDRSFGADKQNVTRKAYAYAQGLLDSGVLPCIKHFPGHGDTTIDSHLELPCLLYDKNRLHDIELFPFKAAIAAHIPAIMTAHLSIPAYEQEQNIPATLSKPIITGLLKQELGFSGLVITDGLGMQGVLKYHKPGELELKSLLAGNDILLCPMDVPRATYLIKQALTTGLLSEDALDEHVIKILQAKFWAFSHRPSPEPGNPDLSQLHTEYAYALKQRLYQAAITVVRDSEHLIPLCLPPSDEQSQQIPQATYKKDLHAKLVQKDILSPSSANKETSTQSDLAESCAYIQIGDTPQNIFAQILTKTIHLDSYHLSATIDQDYASSLVTALASKEKIIIGIHQMSRFPQENFGISQSTRTFIDTLVHLGKKVILVIFGNAYSLAFFDNAQTVLIAYDDDFDAQKAAAQVLLGESIPTGTLPI